MASDASQSATVKSYADDKHIPPLTTKKRKGISRQVTATQLKNFMWNYPTAEVTARYFDVGVQTLYRYIKRWWNLSFDEFRDRNMHHTRHTLIQKAMQLALEKDNVQALTLCLRNLAGWNADSQVPTTLPVIQLQYRLDGPDYDPPRDVTDSAKSESA